MTDGDLLSLSITKLSGQLLLGQAGLFCLLLDFLEELLRLLQLAVQVFLEADVDFHLLLELGNLALQLLLLGHGVQLNFTELVSAILLSRSNLSAALVFEFRLQITTLLLQRTTLVLALLLLRSECPLVLSLHGL